MSEVAIVIGRTPDLVGSLWTDDLLQSLDGCRWPIAVHQTWDFELSTIKWATRQNLAEFVFLPASTVVKDLAVFDRAFGEYAGKSVNLGGVQEGYRFRMYLGKYLTRSVLTLGVPPVTSKWGAVQQECVWCETYARQEECVGGLATVGGNLDHTDVFEDRHGRLNMVVGNEYLQRYKGTWDPAMIRERTA